MTEIGGCALKLVLASCWTFIETDVEVLRGHLHRYMLEYARWKQWIPVDMEFFHTYMEC